MQDIFKINTDNVIYLTFFNNVFLWLFTLITYLLSDNIKPCFENNSSINVGYILER